MIHLNETVFAAEAAERGWTHTTGRLAGTVNTRAVARAAGLSVNAVARAYAGGEVSAGIIARLLTTTGSPFEKLFVVEIPADERVPA